MVSPKPDALQTADLVLRSSDALAELKNRHRQTQKAILFFSSLISEAGVV
jgi:hypothetical protein